MINLKELKKASKNEYAFIGDDDKSIYNISDYVDTGCLALNAMLSDGDIFKGIPLGKRIVLAGEPSTAKSFFSMYIGKAWLDSDPERFIVLFESEGATVKEMMETVEIPTDRVVVLPVSTLEEMRFQSNNVLDVITKDKAQHGKALFILDSLGMLSSEKEMNDSKDGKSTVDMTKAKQAKAIYRTLSLKLSLTQTSMITVSHVYSDMGLFAKNVTAGGSGVTYAGDVVIHLTKAQEKDGTARIGSWITATATKSRFMPEGTKAKVLILFTKGIYKYSWLLDWGLEYGVIKKSGNYYEFPDGQKGMKKAILKDSSQYYTDENLAILRDAIKNRNSFGEGSDNIEFDDIETGEEEE